MVARGIHSLAEQLRALGKHITIETAGTIPPAGIACDLASISPKLANSTPS
jgi:7-carboxy-7-deazaguanine synthase